MVDLWGIQAAARIDKLGRICLEYFTAERTSTLSSELSRTVASDAYSVFINSDTLSILQYSYEMHPSTN